MMITYYDNAHGEPIECIGDVVSNLCFWDCACPDNANHIHHLTEPQCPVCGALYKERPPAREEEVEEWRIKTGFVPPQPEPRASLSV